MTNNHPWELDIPVSTRRVALTGASAVAIFAVAFGFWAAFAPLAGAAVAPGLVAAAGKNQRVQHLEGGIIEKMMVAEGDKVKAGQIIIELDRTAAEAQRSRLEKEFMALSARAARLVAERDGAETIMFPPDLVSEAKGDLDQIMREQTKEFGARLQRYRQERVILQQRVAMLNEQVSGLGAQESALRQQIALVDDEVARKLNLLQKGLTDRSEYTALLRSAAELVGQLGQTRSGILGAKTQIVEAEEQYARLDTQRAETAASELNDVRVQISSSEEQLRGVRAVVGRMEVRAPCDGIVVSMVYNARGNVIKPGESILEIIPTGNDLLVEAKISPLDIDQVAIGKPATLHFSALNTRTTPVVDATVTYVSADRIIDPRTDQSYYLARLKISAAETKGLNIYPGMPVETYIATGKRTFFQYLTKPIFESFSRAIKEE